MAELFVLVALSALLAFIVREIWQDRRSAPPRRTAGDGSLVPGATSLETGLWVLAAVLAVLAVLALLSLSDAPQPPSSGRHAAVHALFGAAFGRFALPALLGAACVSAVCAAVAVRRRRKSS